MMASTRRRCSAFSMIWACIRISSSVRCLPTSVCTLEAHVTRAPHADGGKLVAETVESAEEFAEKYRALVVAEIQVVILWAACSSVPLRASRKRTPREKRDGAPSDAREM